MDIHSVYSSTIARRFPSECKIRFLNTGLVSEKRMRQNSDLSFIKNSNNSGKLH